MMCTACETFTYFKIDTTLSPPQRPKKQQIRALGVVVFIPTAFNSRHSSTEEILNIFESGVPFTMSNVI